MGKREGEERKEKGGRSKEDLRDDRKGRKKMDTIEKEKRETKKEGNNGEKGAQWKKTRKNEKRGGSRVECEIESMGRKERKEADDTMSCVQDGTREEKNVKTERKGYRKNWKGGKREPGTDNEGQGSVNAGGEIGGKEDGTADRSEGMKA